MDFQNLEKETVKRSASTNVEVTFPGFPSLTNKFPRRANLVSLAGKDT